MRNLAYNSFNELEIREGCKANSVTHLVTELRDNYGCSVGYTYAKNNSVQQTVNTGYGSDGRIAMAGFVHGGAIKQFNYAYLNGTHLLQTLTMPNNMSLTQGFEEKRDLLTQMDYKRGNTLVSRRVYTYDTLGRPLTRQTSLNGETVNDSFVHTYRSELASAQVNGQTYAYDYDNIGNRRMSIDASDYAFYDANELNQYSSIRKNEELFFEPTFDAAGNQTLVRTTTGTWSVTYNAENRPIIFQKTTDSVTTRITCTYDYMGRRATKKVEEITTDADGNESITVISNHRFIYRGYLQIGCCDLTRANHPCLWLITWDPTQSVATRPLAIQKDGTWFCYGWDLTKNICEIFGPSGYIRSTYTYTPFGSVTASGDVEQPIQWSSEYCDSELALVYYNYRHYNPTDGRWINRDPIAEQGGWNLYAFVGNDYLGLSGDYNPALFEDYIGAIKYFKHNVALFLIEKIASCAKDVYDKGWTITKNLNEYGGALYRSGKIGKFKYYLSIYEGEKKKYFRQELNTRISSCFCEIAIWHSHPLRFVGDTMGSEDTIRKPRLEGYVGIGSISGPDERIALGFLLEKYRPRLIINANDGQLCKNMHNPKLLPSIIITRKLVNFKNVIVNKKDIYSTILELFSEDDFDIYVLTRKYQNVTNSKLNIIIYDEKFRKIKEKKFPSLDNEPY